MLYNKTLVVDWGQFTNQLVQGLALVAVDIRFQRIANGCHGQKLTATTMEATASQCVIPRGVRQFGGL